jgi:hypothetical protein
MTLDEMLAFAEQRSREILIGTKEQLLPVFMFEDRLGQMTVIGTAWDNARAKARILGALRAKAHADRFVRYVTASEAWIVVRRLSELTPGQLPVPSKTSDRREVVMIFGAEKDGGKLMRMLMIERAPDGSCSGLTLEEEFHDGGLMDGEMTDLLEDDDE